MVSPGCKVGDIFTCVYLVFLSLFPQSSNVQVGRVNSSQKRGSLVQYGEFKCLQVEKVLSNAHWGILIGRENLLVAGTSMFTGASLLLRALQIFRQGELVAETFLLTGLDISAHVWALLEGFFCRFPLPGSEGLRLQGFSLYIYFTFAAMARVMFTGAFTSFFARLG